MKIAVLSDIHGNLAALRSVQADYHHLGIKEAWFLGDLFGDGPDPTQVYGVLKCSPDFRIWLAGNHDLALNGEKGLLDRMNEVARQSTLVHGDLLNEAHKQDVAHHPAMQEVGTYPGVWVSHGLPSGPFDEKDKAVTLYDREHAPHKGEVISEHSILALRERWTPNAWLWLVGHSHRQAAWHHDGTAGTWAQCIQDFGMDLKGESKPWLASTDKTETSTEIDLPLPQSPSLLVLNPGSVGWPRDGLYNNLTGKHMAKYLVIELKGDCIYLNFRAVPYCGDKVVQNWKVPGSPYPKELPRMFLQQSEDN